MLLYFVMLLGFGLGLSESSALSHLVKSDPSARAVLDTVPRELKLWFSEAVEPAFAWLWIVPAQGPPLPLPNHGDNSDHKLLIAALPDNLPAGLVDRFRGSTHIKPLH